MKKFLYLLSQNVNDDYDTFDAVIVCAESEEKAKRIHPQTDKNWYLWCDENKEFYSIDYRGQRERESNYSWVSNIQDIDVKLIGKADKDMEIGIVLASFNAG